jgi:DNA modification methylase
MPTLRVTEEQLRLIQQSLDFYSRIGIGQFERIKEHPTFESHLYNEFKDENGKTDYSKFHSVRDEVDEIFTQAKRLLYNQQSATKNGGWGINHYNVDDSCRDAFDLVQVIRHEFWKKNPNRSDITVDSHINLTDSKNENVKVEL